MSATDEFRPWWERRPGRLRWELTNFADQGLSVRSDHGPDGPQIHGAVELTDARTIEFRVTFPDEYPDLPPRVRVPSGLLGPPHEVSGCLCLFDDAARTWFPQRGAAELVNGRVRALLQGLLVDGHLDAGLEEQIPDQASRLFVNDTSRVVFVGDPFWDSLPETGSGAVFTRGDAHRHVVLMIEGHGVVDEELVEQLGLATAEVSAGRWVALAESPTGGHTPASLLEVARVSHPDLLEPVTFGEVGPVPPQWIALSFPEEGPRIGQWRRSWAFIALNELNPAAIWNTQALTLAERQLRTPELVGLENAKVVLIGAGSLGSKVAFELAKAGCGHLTIFDTDTYDVNNSPRHELSFRQAGDYKADAVAELVRGANPFTGAKPERNEVGFNRVTGEYFLAALEGAALVVETTGARATTRIAHRYCRSVDVPLLCASLTRGSRGGDMVLLDSERCFDCFLLAQAEGEIPKPEEGEQRSPVIPVGCAHPAFSGAGFDSSELASAAARMAVRATGTTTYPALDHNWAVLNFVADPHWQQGTIDPDPRCRHRS